MTWGPPVQSPTCINGAEYMVVARADTEFQKGPGPDICSYIRVHARDVFPLHGVSGVHKKREILGLLRFVMPHDCI